jgi:hypothetical protein
MILELIAFVLAFWLLAAFGALFLGGYLARHDLSQRANAADPLRTDWGLAQGISRHQGSLHAADLDAIPLDANL